MPSNSSMRLRARDTDRVDVCGLLDSAHDDGQLSDFEHRDRTKAAMSARTLTELDALVSDLQIPDKLKGSLPVRPADPDRRRIQGVAAAVAVAAVVALGAVVFSTIGDDGADAPDRPENVLSAPGLARMIEDLRAQYGDAVVDEATIYPEYARIQRAEPGAPGMYQDIDYRDGLEEPDSRTGRDPKTVPVDLARLDIPAVVGLLLGAPQTLGVATPDSIHMSVESGDEAPEVSMYLSDGRAGTSGHLTAGFDGEVFEIHPADD
ncbi:DUF1707 SHOCT-like domain-containing protein [Rhodococcus sp. UNC363MFTsu5.1]|uniref:DUF1707 SHOCT-like domain-containing protein n=1 Tax=Rhodococcus sp. UNC363MFTsu5.1 TaxID=1449069 RepID=UPI0004807D93|nr:DUF1707 domain-containing protein [Rhodococcus sp. UNC363MFTsu5.1]